jgi:hypothetical protein
MTPKTPQGEVFWALLSNLKHSGVPEDSKSPTLEVLGFTPPTLGQSGVATHYVMKIQKLFMKLMQCDYIILNIVVGCKQNNEPTKLMYKRNVYPFFQFFFSYERILEQFVLQLVIMNACSGPST